MPQTYQKRGSGPPFVYVPGLEGTGKLFYKQADDLARDHTLLCLAHRTDGRYSLDDLVEDLRQALRAEGFERATVLGESFGGMVTMAAALAYPELIERMILVNTFSVFPHRGKINLGVALYSMLPYKWIRAYRIKRSGQELFGADVPLEDRRLFHEHTRVVPFEGYLSRLRIIRKTNLRARLPEIKAPALIVAGAEDNLLDSVGAARIMAGAIPRSRLKILDGTGHIALLSSRVRVRDWLAEFEEM